MIGIIYVGLLVISVNSSLAIGTRRTVGEKYDEKR